MVQKTYEMIADHIRGQIESSQLPPGTKLESVEQLAKRYEVGRSSIREALTSLKAQGYLVIRQGDGTFVKERVEPGSPWEVPQPENPRQLQEWLEVREMLETGAAALAAERRTASHLHELESTLARMKAERDEEKLEQIDRDFHLQVAEASGNALLHGALQTLFASIGAGMKESRRVWMFGMKETADELWLEHQAIASAISDQDIQKARSAMSGHLRKVERSLLQSMRSGGATRLGKQE